MDSRGTLGQMDTLPSGGLPDVVVMLITAIATRVSWELPFEVVRAFLRLASPRHPPQAGGGSCRRKGPSRQRPDIRPRDRPAELYAQVTVITDAPRALVARRLCSV